MFAGCLGAVLSRWVLVQSCLTARGSASASRLALTCLLLWTFSCSLLKRAMAKAPSWLKTHSPRLAASCLQEKQSGQAGLPALALQSLLAQPAAGDSSATSSLGIWLQPGPLLHRENFCFVLVCLSGLFPRL